MAKRKHDYAAIREAYKASGQSAADFARANGLTLGIVYAAFAEAGEPIRKRSSRIDKYPDVVAALQSGMAPLDAAAECGVSIATVQRVACEMKKRGEGESASENTGEAPARKPERKPGKKPVEKPEKKPVEKREEQHDENTGEAVVSIGYALNGFPYVDLRRDSIQGIRETLLDNGCYGVALAAIPLESEPDGSVRIFLVEDLPAFIAQSFVGATRRRG